MKKIFVSLPGPWWTRLLYSHNSTLNIGVRVLVPLGRGTRVGIVVPNDGDTENDNSINIKPIKEILDITPPLPQELMRTIKWFSDTWFAGFGMASRVFLPTKFFEGEELSPLKEELSKESAHSVKFNYEEKDEKRYESYFEIAESSAAGSLFLFSEVKSAKKFWSSLSAQIRDGGVLWPSSPKKQWELWKEAREGNIKFIVGSQSASFVPLRGLSLMVVEDEISGGWRTQKNPFFHHRSVLAMRAKFAGATLLLGGRLPSSKVFTQLPQNIKDKKDLSKRLVFVNLHDSSSFPVSAVKDPLPVSKPLIRETLYSRENGKWAFWILDRKGYAGEIFCSDCGESLRCSVCAGIMRWEEKQKRLSCLSCKNKIPIPERCLSCGGPFLEGKRPGLEALSERASLILKYKYKEIIAVSDEKAKLPTASKLIKEYPRGALIVGTRRVLSLVDELPTGMIGWIDSDAEARVSEYNAKARAYSLLYESSWRGLNPEQRKIVIQSRRPEKGWQRGLSRGWSYFWERELKEREEWHLPPYIPMIKIIMTKGTGSIFSGLLEEKDVEYWSSEELPDEIWVRTKKFKLIKDLLAPYFEIRNSRKGYPEITLYLD